MAGHSKWKNIRIRKGKQDAIRGKVFTRLSREIMIAAKGGADPDTNVTLRMAIDKAKEASVPKDNIERAVAKGSGQIDGENYEEITYEGVGPGGVAFMVDVYSENRNRTVAELRHAFSKGGGGLTENGSVAWQFRLLGQIIVKKANVDEDELTMAAIEGGAEDVVTDDEEVFVIFTPVEALHSCREAIMSAGFKADDAQLTRLATNKVSPTKEELIRTVKLMDVLDDLDDVKETFVNVDIPDEIYDLV